MRAVVHHTFGEPTDVLVVEDRPLPEPGPGQVRIRLTASPVHNHDLWTVRGTYGFKPELPARSGSEAVGVIDALGDGVEQLQTGQRVVAGGSFGAWAEFFLAEAAGLVPVPDALADESAAQLVAMPFSAIGILEALQLQPGDWMVQNAANGAVGRMVAQLAVARQVNVIGLVRRAEAVTELAGQGIDRIVSTDAEGWREQVAELSGGAGIRAGVDSVGGKASGEVLSLLGEGGTLLAFGAMGAPVMEISTGDMIFKQATVKGFWGGVVSKQMDAGTRQRLFGELMERILSGQLTLPVAGTFGLDQAREAAAANAEAGRIGKILLRP